MSASSFLFHASLRCLLAALAFAGLIAAARAAAPDVADLATQVSELRAQLARLDSENVALRRQSGVDAPSTVAAPDRLRGPGGHRFRETPDLGDRATGTFTSATRRPPPARLGSRPTITRRYPVETSVNP